MDIFNAPFRPEPWVDDNSSTDFLDMPTLDGTEDTDSSSEIIDSEPAIISSDTSESALTARTIIYSVEIPEYPNTDIDGVAYLVNIQGKSEEDVEYIIQSMQYCHARKYPKKESRSSILDGARCTREVFTCTGIKGCEFLHPRIKALNHSTQTEDMWQVIQDIRAEGFKDNLRRQANSFFLSIQNIFSKKKACQGQMDSCQWEFVQLPDTTTSNVPLYVVRCKNRPQRNFNHFLKDIPIALQPEIDFLRLRFTSPQLPSTADSCGIILQNSSRRRTCGIDHVQGQGKLEYYRCSVTFNLFRPTDPIATPYIIFTSHGVHSHPPPPPTKTPEQLLTSLLGVIRSISDPSLTLNSLLKNPALHQFCQQYNRRSLIEIHQSLANSDKISSLIRKQRILDYPDGQSITGVELEYHQRHRDNPERYIQAVYNDGVNFYVICFFRQQVELLAKRESFEINIGFKRLRVQEEKEIVFAGFLPEVNKVITFARIFVNQDTTEMYKRVFQHFFQIVEDQYQIPIRWQHLHGSGFQAVVLDQDSKQYAGFGKYLSLIDPDHHNWQWHVKRSVIFCLIHFQRGIEKLVGSRDRSPESLWSRMMELHKCQSKEEYIRLCDLLITSLESPACIAEWALHKKHDIIASGLNKFCSEIDPAVFDRIRKHTNAVESSHHKSNSMGRYLSLLRAIHFAEILDRKDFEQYIATSQYGINSKWPANSLSARYEDIQRRSSKFLL
ncbi:hypothetical protein K432DRAFT_33984 [Lepidopterella palustris CBS 459.81]|uniref:Uncharacterized protein n=1 Tax=Lepidopterella palustris CBS 459.81 TaxID=1314670 RepID=A0A8E2JK60_9PEZI|nr:hypothetical protein K432DRAFT_33984 [Lepidopterella palustris CBS 459.81]